MIVQRRRRRAFDKSSSSLICFKLKSRIFQSLEADFCLLQSLLKLSNLLETFICTFLNIFLLFICWKRSEKKRNFSVWFLVQDIGKQLMTSSCCGVCIIGIKRDNQFRPIYSFTTHYFSLTILFCFIYLFTRFHIYGWSWVFFVFFLNTQTKFIRITRKFFNLISFSINPSLLVTLF